MAVANAFENGPFNSKVLNHQALAEPFPVRISVRSPEHERLIRSSTTSTSLWAAPEQRLSYE